MQLTLCGYARARQEAQALHLVKTLNMVHVTCDHIFQPSPLRGLSTCVNVYNVALITDKTIPSQETATLSFQTAHLRINL